MTGAARANSARGQRGTLRQELISGCADHFGDRAGSRLRNVKPFTRPARHGVDQACGIDALATLRRTTFWYTGCPYMVWR